jgi:SAM-dependent methyltransferase
MDESAYVDLHQLEQKHWWYRGTRSVYRTLLRHYAPRARGPVLDLGCGSGGNLELLSNWGLVTGLDPWPPALHLCAGTGARLVQGQAEALPFCDAAFGLVAMLGVLEHVTEDMRMLREARRVCRPSGTLLLLTSAFHFLWSAHDAANRHVRRYTAGELRAKATRVGLRVRYLGYVNVALFPAIACIRLAQRLIAGASEPHIDMWPQPEPINTMLARLLALEGWLMQWQSFPAGVSLVAVLER